MRLSASMISTAVFAVLVSGLVTGAVAGQQSAQHGTGTIVHVAQAAPADVQVPDDDRWG
jgi:hypothetical protein